MNDNTKVKRSCKTSYKSKDDNNINGLGVSCSKISLRNLSYKNNLHLLHSAYLVTYARHNLSSAVRTHESLPTAVLAKNRSAGSYFALTALNPS